MRTSTCAGVALAAGLFLGAGCDDGTTGPGPDGVEGVHFQYSGARSGTFQVSGAPTLDTDGSVNYGEWTAAQLDSVGGLVIASFRPTESPNGDLFILQLGPAAVRSWNDLCGTGTQENGDRCGGRLLVSFDAQTLQTLTPADHYEAVSGSATITELTETRVKGTFSLVMRNNYGDGTETITLSNGQFDAPIIGGATGNAVLCVVKRVTSDTSDPCAEGWDP
jgi:hypothetical protein